MSQAVLHFSYNEQHKIDAGLGHKLCIKLRYYGRLWKGLIRITTICIPEIFTPYFFKENIYGKG